MEGVEVAFLGPDSFRSSLTALFRRSEKYPVFVHLPVVVAIVEAERSVDPQTMEDLCFPFSCMNPSAIVPSEDHSVHRDSRRMVTRSVVRPDLGMIEG
jgi:hypothetical protein